MLGYCNECRQQKLFYFEQHAISDVAQVSRQKIFTLNFFEDVLLRKLLDDDQNSNFRLFFNVFRFLVFAF
jgi:hypothetical protein